MNLRQKIIGKWTLMHSYFLGLFLVIIASWAKFLATGSLLVDNNPALNNSVYFIFSLFCLGLGINGWAYYKLIFTNTYSLITIRKWAIGVISLGFLMLPMLSNDSFLYLAYGNLLNNGMVTYVTPDLIQHSDFVQYVAPVWLDCPNHYGPILLFLFGLVTWFGGKMWSSLILLKIFFWLISIGVIQGLYYFFQQLIKTTPKKYKQLTTQYAQFFLLLSLAPVFWIQGIGQLHSEVVIMLFVVGLVYGLYFEKWILAASMVGLIAGSKIMYGAVFIPFLFLFIVFKFRTAWQSIFKIAALSFLLISGIIATCYYPVWEGTETITTALAYHENKMPNHSIVGVLTELLFYGQQLLENQAINIGQWVIETEQGVDKGMIAKPLSKFFQLIGLALAVWVMLEIIFIKKKGEVFKIFGKTLLVVICFYSPIFQPWYFLMILPFFCLTNKQSWLQFMAVVFTFSNFQAIAYSAPSSSWVHLLSLVFVPLMVGSFFWYFKRHFIQETATQIKNYSNRIIQLDFSFLK